MSNNPLADLIRKQIEANDRLREAEAAYEEAERHLRAVAEGQPAYFNSVAAAEGFKSSLAGACDGKKCAANAKKSARRTYDNLGKAICDIIPLYGCWIKVGDWGVAKYRDLWDKETKLILTAWPDNDNDVPSVNIKDR